MLLISCPWCGPRAEPEFRWGGQAHLPRPPLKASDAQWSAYLFLRDNPRGLALERWTHAHGCGLWFNLARDTATHRIATVYPIDGSAPSRGGDPQGGPAAKLGGGDPATGAPS